MAPEQELTGKAKKAKRAEDRLKSSKKRKRHQDPEPLPREDDQSDEEPADDAASAITQNVETVDDAASTITKSAEAVDDNGDAAAAVPRKKRKRGRNADSAPRKDRFIVFVGNLPYSITTEQIQEHFASIKPESIRNPTDPETSKSKGYAFLEFGNYDRMQTCLKKFHHTEIDSGVGGKKGVKKINVELTAGGGGHGEQRKGKLQAKNQRLKEQRERRAEEVAKQEKRKTGEDGDAGRPSAVNKVGEVSADDTGVHPSRLARING